MKFLLVKSLFCPNQQYYETTVKSIVGINIFIKLLKSNLSVSIDVLYIGWINSHSDAFDKYLQLCEPEMKLLYSNIYKELWKINYGKYKIYNNMIDFVKLMKQTDNDYDFIIYLDHDIYLDFDQIDLFQSVSLLENYRIDSCRLGICALNHLEDIRHQTDIYTNQYTACDFQLLRPSRVGSIASGAFIIFPDILIELNGFDILTIYGLDDYQLDQKLITLGCINVVIGNMFAVHPFDDNIQYSAWKKNHLLRLINGESQKNNYYLEIQESINFWNK
jgi:hypothetical protein